MMDVNRKLVMYDQSSVCSLYRAAERLSLDELQSKVNFYEERVDELERMKGIRGILSRTFIGSPIILDNVHPLHGDENIYRAARAVLESKLENDD